MLDDEWEKWKEAKVQLDDHIVECAWHPPSYHDTVPTWHIKRIRDDKVRANHYTTVDNVVQSILDGVELEQVFMCSYIKEGYTNSQSASSSRARNSQSMEGKRGKKSTFTSTFS